MSRLQIALDRHPLVDAWAFGARLEAPVVHQRIFDDLEGGDDVLGRPQAVGGRRADKKIRGLGIDDVLELGALHEAPELSERS